MPFPTRRTFLRALALGGAAGVGAVRPVRAALAQAVIAPPPAGAEDERGYWLHLAARVSRPVLTHLAAGQLKAHMPVEAPAAAPNARRAFSHLEAFGRTVAGLAPWLEAEAPAGGPAAATAALVRQGLAVATDPAAADFMNFQEGGQPLVDAAFLGYGLLLAPAALWDPLSAAVQERVLAALRATRVLAPPTNNWLLFSAMIETCLARFGAAWNPVPIDRAVRAHEGWYKGDGSYGDGPHFHWDYYNSYVIQPFLTTILEVIRPYDPRWQGDAARVGERAVRYAAVQERMIAADGSFPPVGRSLCYRCGAFHHLAHQSWRGRLPAEVSPAQVRCALTAVFRRTLGVAGTFDQAGWLRVGLSGAQPSLAEPYISTGSLYLCLLAFHPLGLAPSNLFWRAPAADWTQRKVWAGRDLPADHALSDL